MIDLQSENSAYGANDADIPSSWDLCPASIEAPLRGAPQDEEDGVLHVKATIRLTPTDVILRCSSEGRASKDARRSGLTPAPSAPAPVSRRAGRSRPSR